MTTKPALQKIVKGILCMKEAERHKHKSLGKDKFQEKSR
jgi:hypothetical protein